jgi:hypothetical protein
MPEQVGVTATRLNFELLAAVVLGTLVLAVPLLLLVRAMRREDRRTRLANAPLTGLVILCIVSIGAWLYVTLANVEISARINGPIQTVLLAIAAIAVYLLWLVVPVAAVTWLVFKLPEIAARGPKVRAALRGIGIAAAAGGTYFAFLTGGKIWDFVSLLRGLSSYPPGVVAPGIVIVAVIAFIFVIVLGSLTGVLLLIAAWALEPRKRWREWRTPTSRNSELPPA